MKLYEVILLYVHTRDKHGMCGVVCKAYGS